VSLLVDLRLRLGGFELAVAFEAFQGITALFGPSGAGKTLTLRSIAGLTGPDSGRIVLSGRTLLDRESGIDLRPQERGVGYVFQQYALFPHLDVGRNVAFGISSRGDDRTEKVRSLLELVGLAGHERRRVTELSGGQQQRVALARALATDPKLLLLDEPFAAVDLRVRRRLRAELRRIHDVTGTPMLLVTHDLPEVRELSDSLVLIDHGRVLCSGPTESILATADPALAELLDD
jgi:molybdate transport system ATP-binding protein